MFFNLSKILIFLTDPLFYLMFFALLGSFQFKKRKLAVSIFVVFYLISIPLVGERLMYSMEHWVKPTFTEQKTYDAAIVLTGMVHLAISDSKKIEFSGAVDRILNGIELVKSGKAKYLIISGGSGSLFQKDQAEAIILESFAKQAGVPSDIILTDTTSKNTYQNAVNTKKLLNEHHLKNVVLITSAFHMFRSKGCFKKVGLPVDVLPVDYNATNEVTDFRFFIPSTSAISTFNTFVHELLGIVVYGVSGKADYF